MRVLDGVFTTSNVRDTILWLLVVIENVKSRLALMSLQNANADGGGGGGGDRLFYSHIIIFSISRTITPRMHLNYYFHYRTVRISTSVCAILF